MTADISRRTVLRAAGLTLLAAGAAGCTNGALSAVTQDPSSAAADPAAGSRTTRSLPTASSPPVPSTAATATPAVTAVPAPPGGPSVEVGTGPAGSQQVALTFHGGGDPAT